jgi:hypothetical protein
VIRAAKSIGAKNVERGGCGWVWQWLALRHYCECLSATGFDNSAASRTEPPTVRLEAIRNRIVPLILHLSAKSLHIGSTSTLLFGSAQVALCAASLGRSNRR